MREALVFVAKLPVVKCIDTNPIKLTIPRLGQGLRKIDTNPITLTNQRLARGSLNQRLARGSLNQRLARRSLNLCQST